MEISYSVPTLLSMASQSIEKIPIELIEKKSSTDNIKNLLFIHLQLLRKITWDFPSTKRSRILKALSYKEDVVSTTEKRIINYEESNTETANCIIAIRKDLTILNNKLCDLYDLRLRKSSYLPMEVEYWNVLKNKVIDINTRIFAEKLFTCLTETKPFGVSKDYGMVITNSIRFLFFEDSDEVANSNIHSAKKTVAEKKLNMIKRDFKDNTELNKTCVADPNKYKDINKWFAKYNKQLSRIIRLNLSNSKLSFIPSQIQYLTNLEQLDISNNNIYCWPKEAKNLQSLVRVQTAGNPGNLKIPNLSLARNIICAAAPNHENDFSKKPKPSALDLLDLL